MLATHAGTLFDLFKQVVLANALAAQRPAEYWESHAQPALLPANPTDHHGMNRFLEAAADNVGLSRTPLYRQLERLSDSKDFVPGTSWLAMQALGKEARRFLFCSQDAASLQSIQAERKKSLGVDETKVECIQEDGIALLRGATMVLSEHWTSTTLAFLDPPEIDMATDAGISPLELWCEIANRGIPALLAFTFADADRRGALRARLGAAIQKSRLTSGKLYRFEGALVHTSAAMPPIPWGFGVISANIAENAVLAADRELFTLQSAFAGTTLEGWGDGMWKYSGERY